MSDVLDVLSDPNIAFLLLVIGGLGLATELIHPNVLTGILGAFALLLAVIGLGSLPLNWPGLILLIAGFVLFVLETQIVSHGLLGLAGTICVAIGALSLYRQPSVGDTLVRVDPLVIGSTSGLLLLVALGLGVVAARTRRLPAPVGQLGAPVPVGTPGVVVAPLGSAGLRAARWRALERADARRQPPAAGHARAPGAVRRAHRHRGPDRPSRHAARGVVGAARPIQPDPSAAVTAADRS